MPPAAIRSKRSLGGKKLKDIKSVFQAIDKDGSGDLDHQEFTLAMDRLGLGLSQDQITQCIEVLDVDNDGEVSYDEFRLAMRRLGLGLTHDQIQQCIEVLDKDHDGEVSLTEFMILVNGGDEPERAPNPDEEALMIWRAAFDKFDLDGNGSSPACCSASALPSM